MLQKETESDKLGSVLICEKNNNVYNTTKPKGDI